jgi:hypothetical protein
MGAPGLLNAKHMNEGDTAAKDKLEFSTYAEKSLLGRTIVAIRYLNDTEADGLGWSASPIVLLLDDGAMIYPAQDDEGNGPGALIGQTKTGKELLIPVV